MDGELLLHLDIAETIRKRGNDGLICHLGDLDPCTIEVLDVLLQGLSWLLLDAAQVTRRRRVVASALEVGDEALVELVPRGDRPHRKVQGPRACAVLEGHGEPVRCALLVAIGHLDAQLVERQALRGVGGAVITRGQIRLKLAQLGDAT